MTTPKISVNSSTIGLLAQSVPSYLRQSPGVKGNDTNSFTQTRNLAIAYQRKSQFDKAGELFNAILQPCLKLYGAQDARTILAKEDIGINLAQQGYYKEAQNLFEIVLVQRKMALDQSKPSKSRAIYLLKAVIRRLLPPQRGQPDVAQDTGLYGRIQVADAYHNLANVLRAQGNFDEARVDYWSAISIYSKTLKSPCYRELISLAGLSSLNVSQGRYNEAKECLGKIREGYLELSKDEPASEPAFDHPIDALMASVTQSEATISDLCGYTDQAESLFLEAWEGIQKARPQDHPDVIDLTVD